MRILLFDTSANGSPWPLFLQDLEALTKTKIGQYAYRFVDEAPFLDRRSTVNRALTASLIGSRLTSRSGVPVCLHMKRRPAFCDIGVIRCVTLISTADY